MASAEELLNRSFSEHHASWIPTDVVMVIEAMDPESGEPHLFHVHSDETTAWKAIGMAEVALGDMRHACIEVDE